MSVGKTALLIAGARRLHRVLRVPFGIGAEHLVRQLFLLIGHRIVKILEGWNELLHMLCMLLGDLLVGLHVLHRVHRSETIDALKPYLVHIASVLAHYLRELIPLRALIRGDAELGMQLFDPLFDALFGGFSGHWVPGQWRRRDGSRFPCFRCHRSLRRLSQSDCGEAEKCDYSCRSKTI